MRAIRQALNSSLPVVFISPPSERPTGQSRKSTGFKWMRDRLANIAAGKRRAAFVRRTYATGAAARTTRGSPDDAKLHLSGDINGEHYPPSYEHARERECSGVVGVKLHYNDNERTSAMRKTRRKRSRVRSSWNLEPAYIYAQNIKSHRNTLKTSWRTVPSRGRRK